MFSSIILVLHHFMEQFCYADGEYRTAGYAWNDSFQNVTQATSAVNYYQRIYHKKKALAIAVL